MENSSMLRIKNLIESLRIDEKEKVKIKIKHPGLLDIPEDKKFWQMPFKHYTDLVDKKSYSKVIKALNNLKVWNEEDNKDISNRAEKLMNRLKKKFRPEEE